MLKSLKQTLYDIINKQTSKNSVHFDLYKESYLLYYYKSKN